MGFLLSVQRMYVVHQLETSGYPENHQGNPAYRDVQCAAFLGKGVCRRTGKINETTGLKKALMLDALRVGKEHNITYLMNGKTPPAVLHMRYKFYERTIYSLLKKTIGIENGNFFPTAGAAIPER